MRGRDRGVAGGVEPARLAVGHVARAVLGGERLGLGVGRVVLDHDQLGAVLGRLGRRGGERHRQVVAPPAGRDEDRGSDREVVLALHTSSRTATITVRDHGKGIPDYAKDKVFQKFYSLARPHSQKKSTGLGLAFVKEIAALHRGSIELANAPRGGALATLALPLSHA